MKWVPKAGVDANASRVLPKLASRYFDAGIALFGLDRTPEKFHDFRLRTKHFRYTLELFADYYGTEFGTLLKRLKPVQEALGEINDAATALAWLHQDDPAALRDWLVRRIAEKSARFEKYWAAVFAKPGERERWDAVLRSASAKKDGTLRKERGDGCGSSILLRE